MSERGWLYAAEAAQVLRVSPKTVSRWAREGKLASTKTLGGHRRFDRADIEALAAAQSTTSPGSDSGRGGRAGRLGP